MQFIYDRTDWPELTFDESPLSDALLQFYHVQGRLYGKLDAFGFDVQNELLLNSISDEVVTSSEIEGEILNRSSVRSSVAKKLGLETAGLTYVSSDHYADGVFNIPCNLTS